MNLQEQINRIHQMMGIINETKGSSVSVEFIPKNNRIEKTDLIEEIAIACYGTPERADFTDKFSPHKIIGNKVENFKEYLVSTPKLLWAIKYNDEIVGFINISDYPFHNSIGAAINVEYASKGIMKIAFNLIKNDSNITYPIYGYTLMSNEAAQKVMINLGFIEKKFAPGIAKFEYNPNDVMKDNTDLDLDKDIEKKKNIIDNLSFYSNTNEENNKTIFNLEKKRFIDEFIEKYFQNEDKPMKKIELTNNNYKDLDEKTKENWNEFINSYRNL
jgi:RimJ/RimL family protein N-acetyltransferase